MRALPESAFGSAMTATPRPRGYWFSKNPSKAWGEKFFLLYTPYWMLGMGLLMRSGAGARWSDLA